MDKPSLRPAAVLLLFYYWLCTSFFLGTLTLMGPVRWTVSRARAAGWPDSVEKALVLCFIALLAAVSFVCARRLAARTRAAAPKVRYGAAAGALALFAAALWFWMNPKFMIDPGAQTASAGFSGTEFVFGPYPDKDRLAGLKTEGYAAVISLLSPAVVPFEPVLIHEEKEAAAAAGIELVHIPMLPWVSSNDHVQRELKLLLARGPARYYVHCYLGKDRVNVFKKFLGTVSGEVSLKSLAPSAARTLKGLAAFERGAITPLEKDVYFTPYPTDEEFFGYILNGTVTSLVSLLDPANPENLPWMKKEKAVAEKHGLKFVNYPWKSLNAGKKAGAVRAIKALPRPAVIHAFLSKSPECLEFISAYSAAGKK